MEKKEIFSVVEALKEQHHRVQRQCEEHLQSINENTTEIQALFDYLHELDLKIEKLAQRVDVVQLSNQQSEKPAIYPLTTIEKHIFLALYTEGMPITIGEIAEKTGLSAAVIHEQITTLAQKGIPVLRTVANNQLFVKLNEEFKELQARENVVNLSLQSFME